jgi:hypothetical protein
LQIKPRWVLSGLRLDQVPTIHSVERGRSSGVERNLAKVEVVSSNLIARSKFFSPITVEKFYAGRARQFGHPLLADSLASLPAALPAGGQSGILWACAVDAPRVGLRELGS